MDSLAWVIDLSLAVFVAFIGGTLAHRLRQPVLVGYLVAGVAIGPFTPGPHADYQSVHIMAEIGVAFLMFALGAEFSLGELKKLGKVAAIGGPIQILATIALGPIIGAILGLPLMQGIFLGALLALSSTVVAMKMLMGRGELQSLHGRAALGILLAQDMAVVPMVIVLPALAQGTEGLLVELGIAAAKAAGVLLGAYFLGTRLVPRALARAAVPQTRELFILGVVALALGTGIITSYFGLSFAFGAFLAGLVVAESEFRTQVVAEVLPLRDLFTSLFFVSVGMLIDPISLPSQAATILTVAGITVIGKVVIVTVLLLLLGLPGPVALFASLSLAQVGEFSFVLARIGVDSNAIPPSLFDLTLTTSLVTILVSPLLLRIGPPLLQGLQRLPLIGARFKSPVEADPTTEGLRRHTVICGFGKVGQELADALEKRNIPFLVIDYNPDVVREMRERGIPVIFGDAGNPVVLEHAHLDRATLLAVLTPDYRTAELATRHAHTRYPRLDIVARAANASEINRLKDAGAMDAVQPEFEAGVEVIRHTMQRYGIGGLELTRLASGRRAAFYLRESPRE